MVLDAAIGREGKATEESAVAEHTSPICAATLPQPSRGPGAAGGERLAVDAETAVA
jgi:hypothetical protein